MRKEADCHYACVPRNWSVSPCYKNKTMTSRLTRESQNYTAFFWAGLCFLCIIYTYFRIPEPRGRTFAELDLLFERKISARNFAKTEVDVFDEAVDGSVINQYKDTLAMTHSEKVGGIGGGSAADGRVAGMTGMT